MAFEHATRTRVYSDSDAARFQVFVRLILDFSGHEVGPCKTDTCYHHKDFSADTNLRPIASLKIGVDVRPVGAGAPTRTAQHGRFHESLRACARGP